MTTLRYAMLSALLSPLMHDEEEQEPGAQATGRPTEQNQPPGIQGVDPAA